MLERTRRAQGDMVRESSVGTATPASGVSFVDLNAVNFGELATAYRWNVRASLYAIQDLFTRDAYCAELVRNAVDFVVGGSDPVDFGVEAINQRFRDWRPLATAPEANVRDLRKFAMVSLFRDGDIIQEKAEARFDTGLRLYPLEPRYVFYNAQGRDRVQAGVEVNADLEPAAYHYYPTAQPIGSLNPTEERDIPADDVIHVFRYEWANQARGLSWLSHSYDPLRALREFDQLIPEGAARAIKTRGFLSVPNKYFTEARVEADDDDEIAAAKKLLREQDKDDFATTKIYPEDIEWVSQMSSGITQGNVITATRMILLERAARGFGLSAYSMSANFGDTGVYASRQAYLLDLKFYKNSQDYLQQFDRAVADWWVDYWREVEPELFAEYTGYTLQSSPFPYADPLRDAQALKILLSLPMTSPQQMMREQGVSVEQMKAEIKEWAAFQKEIRDEFGVEISQPFGGTESSDGEAEDSDFQKVDNMQ